MKIEEREFDTTNGNRPKVLLLGNGLCRSYGGMSWDKLLNTIKDTSKFPLDASKYIMPMPLKAAMLSDNTLATKMRGLVSKHVSDPTSASSDIGWESFVATTPEMRNHLRQLILGNFDYVLTTNYSYEIELALLDKSALSTKQIEKIQHFHEVDNAQTKYMTNTFNLVKNTPIWHIHGEARKPDSMIIGTDYYGRLLQRCIERVAGPGAVHDKEKKNSSGKARGYKENKTQKIGSWIDAFLLGNVYLLGFGMDFSETDLWWLMNYKSTHPDFCGKAVFYEPIENTDKTCVLDSNLPCDKSVSYETTQQCRDLLLREVYHVETKNLGCTIADPNRDYKTFYEAAIDDILKDIRS